MVVNDDRMVKKLEARYRGPYKIIGITETNNYILEDVLGKKLENTLPLHKLKICSNKEGAKFYEVEKILDHKVVNKKKLYLVKWKNFDDTANSWEPPENFANLKVIDSYLEKCTPKQRKSARLNNLSKMVTTLLIFLVLLPWTFGQKVNVLNNSINSSFVYCDLKDDMLSINIDEICYKNINGMSFTNDFKKWLSNNFNFISNDSSTIYDFNNTAGYLNFNATLLSRAIDKISGKAYQCKVIKMKRTWTVSFWGNRYRSDETTIEMVSADQCWLMVKSKMCDDNKMDCEGDTCSYDKMPDDNYSWLSDKTNTFKHCFVAPRMIAEVEEDSIIFTGHCKVKDWYCNLKDSIVVWNKDVVHECPFRKIADSYFQTEGPYLIINSLKLALQIKRMEFFCNIEMVVTTEGLYVAPLSKHLNSVLIDDGGDTKELTNLMLADSDYRTLKNINEEYEILYKECKNFVYMLKLFSFQQDKFLRIEDFKKKEVIIYTHNSQIYLPRCVNLTKISIIINSKSCYEDIPVQFIINGNIMEGFLTNDKIIQFFLRRRCYKCDVE